MQHRRTAEGNGITQLYVRPMLDQQTSDFVVAFGDGDLEGGETRDLNHGGMRGRTFRAAFPRCEDVDVGVLGE